ncbi:MAG: hypothetical protein QOI48_1993 [Solirubrobacteraceae bacterium]|nr:hypothetical protein [Solirubrobacteraceae bacterium]
MRSVPRPRSMPETARAPTVRELRRVVVKPPHGYGGKCVVTGAHAETADLERLADELERHPDGGEDTWVLA